MSASRRTIVEMSMRNIFERVTYTNGLKMANKISHQFQDFIIFNIKTPNIFI